MIAAHPADAAKLLAARDAAVEVFVEKDWPRLRKTMKGDFCRKIDQWIETHRKGK